MKKTKKIIVCAYAVYPFIKSSEGIVNKNWIDILNKNLLKSYYASANMTIETSRTQSFFSSENRILTFLYFCIKNPKSSVSGFLFRVLNIIHRNFLFNSANKSSLYEILWKKIQSYKLVRVLKSSPEDTICWVRLLPSMSFAPIVNAYKYQKIPIVINFNDPIESCVAEHKFLIENLDIAQCYTFPSNRLLHTFVKQFDLDFKRCFVVPHAMLEQQKIFQGRNLNSLKMKFVYCGTFYKSAFSPQLKDALLQFSKTAEGQNVDFLFILSQFDDASKEWLQNTISSVKIITNVDRSEVLQICLSADCLLVIDAIGHDNLLKGKLVEAISLGMPIFAATYKNSVMDNLILEYGGIVAYQDEFDDVFCKLKQLSENLNDVVWIKNFIKNRTSVMQKISEKNIFKATSDIADYALTRFGWSETMIGTEPVAPSGYNWP